MVKIELLPSHNPIHILPSIFPIYPHLPHLNIYLGAQSNNLGVILDLLSFPKLPTSKPSAGPICSTYKIHLELAHSLAFHPPPP